MAELHESIIVTYRKKLFKRGYKESRSPMPTFRPDIFAQLRSQRGILIREIAVEAEIEPTLHSEHTSHQLVLMDEYIRHQRRTRMRVEGILLVPKAKGTINLAESLLMTLFPTKNAIQVIGA